MSFGKVDYTGKAGKDWYCPTAPGNGPGAVTQHKAAAMGIKTQPAPTVRVHVPGIMGGK
jgi:hypothetical protein